MKTIFKFLPAFLFITSALSQTPNLLPTSRVTGCLTVDSMAVIKDTLRAMENIEAQKELTVDGTTTLGKALVRDSLKVMEDIQAEKELTVDGTSTFNGEARFNNNLVFKNSGALKFYPGSNGSPDLFYLGKPTDPAPVLPSQCLLPTTTNGTVNSGYLHFIGNSGYGGTPNMLSMGFDGANGFIDMAGTSTIPNVPSLLLNYYCGRDVGICVGPNGGYVSTGKNFEVGFPSRDVTIAANVNGGLDQTGLSIRTNHQTPFLHNTRFISNNETTRLLGGLFSGASGEKEVFSVKANGETYWGEDYTNSNHKPTLYISPSLANGNYTDGRVSVGTTNINARFNVEADNITGMEIKTTNNANYSYNTLFSVDNDLAKVMVATNNNYQGGGASKETFVVFGDGRTNIGTKLPDAATGHQLAMLTVNGKIACQELYVIKPANWADYVFETNYKLPSLKEVEKYINENKHLPDVPSEAEVKKNGIASSEMDATLLKKIEELTLYVIELEKKIEALQNKK